MRPRRKATRGHGHLLGWWAPKQEGVAYFVLNQQTPVLVVRHPKLKVGDQITS
jgi:hypothetical protein